MERLRDIFGHPHELVVHKEWRSALHHKVANGLCGILDEVFQRERLSSGKLCHDVGEREGEVA